ncbi:hypothetical protein Pmar_PMAR012058 [Perkinsus marinus ATCC 50983]|uniref:Uncharacterized protein n=1 Tax=Perkinsus marinus (strain ATCC 50983 / TXsc) TaxID=423536 RepID=C5LSC3_PERM5|nr:hypothetical protein Pmar_PMAR012058 [Perkinsus marinus ATCC 50983]EER00373.1 hypothetical protein Pmar_PMAR012058 [Perkinsus marinus ATCC 50983]|eukprot:XP_002767655.1 hypothetical protein Pmar_PMAR012058 [Perkinsus marinus ATCC 50983]
MDLESIAESVGVSVAHVDNPRQPTIQEMASITSSSASALVALKWFHKPDKPPVYLKYSPTSIKLARQHISYSKGRPLIEEAGPVISTTTTTTKAKVNQYITKKGTDGPWDIFKFLVPECLRKGIPIPQWGLHYADVRRHFQRWKTAPMAVRKNKKWGQLTQNNFTAA